jgi:hypothetical protein
MLEKINSQYKSANTLVKSQLYRSSSQEVGQVFGELFPMGLDYFHELNPAFLFRISNAEYLNNFSAVTVRDGSAAFGSFLLKNFQIIPELKTHFFIHPNLARLVPEHLKNQFSTWHVGQNKQINISKAKRVVIVGLMSDQTLSPLSVVKDHLKILSQASSTCEVHLFLPHRRDPLGLMWKESYAGYEVVEAIKNQIPNKMITFLSYRDFVEIPSWQDTFCIDLTPNHLVITDSFVNHFSAARGATVESFSGNNNNDQVFEIDLSFNHKIQFSPLPKVESIFPEMVFYKKAAATRDYAFDPAFHALLS